MGRPNHSSGEFIRTHIKGSFIYDEELVVVGEQALALALSGAKGPVHLNIPIREPFYPDSLDEFKIATKGTKFTKEKYIKLKNRLGMGSNRF